MFDWLARLVGREIVYLLDFDGEINKRWAKKTPFGLVCWRMLGVDKVRLLPGGKVQGSCYVTNWKYADVRKEGE